MKYIYAILRFNFRNPGVISNYTCDNLGCNSARVFNGA